MKFERCCAERSGPNSKKAKPQTVDLHRHKGPGCLFRLIRGEQPTSHLKA